LVKDKISKTKKANPTLKGRKQSEEHIKNKALSKRKGSYFNCQKCSNIFWRKPSEIKNGQNKYCSKICYFDAQKGVPKISGFKLNPLIGDKNKNWKGGITPINKSIRGSLEYKKWREEVFNRDNYSCTECGAKSQKGVSVYLEAHHIMPFATHPKLRFATENGQTLCKKCHNKKPKGKQVYAYINS
jgi:hypothetical protein